MTQWQNVSVVLWRFHLGLTGVKVGADHLFAVDGVKGGEGASSSSFRRVTVLQGFVKAEVRVLHQLIAPAVPGSPAQTAHRLFVCRRFCRKEEEEDGSLGGLSRYSVFTNQTKILFSFTGESC